MRRLALLVLLMGAVLAEAAELRGRARGAKAARALALEPEEERGLFDDFIGSVSDGFERAKQAVSEKASSVKDTVSRGLDEAKTAAQRKASEAKEAASRGLNDVSRKASEARDTVSRGLDEAKTAAQRKASEAKEAASRA
ncbi:hypothetical protein FNF27_08327 [Cafeteria roenbergensis]|uniref:RxLR effector protein n=1 Tax=Cafeteria roenbergensis TaxID=33653 RepID=A0A5A8D311_CAFRO|nr:hypothetical protein FNF27_08327 [Cafeteria roenbergensis]